VCAAIGTGDLLDLPFQGFDLPGQRLVIVSAEQEVQGRPRCCELEAGPLIVLHTALKDTAGTLSQVGQPANGLAHHCCPGLVDPQAECRIAQVAVDRIRGHVR
jgi:hypothetical protein